MSTRPVRQKHAQHRGLRSGKIRESAARRTRTDHSQRGAELPVFHAVEVIEPETGRQVENQAACCSAVIPAAVPLTLVGRWLAGLLRIWQAEYAVNGDVSVSGPSDDSRLTRVELTAGDIEQLKAMGLIRRVQRRAEFRSGVPAARCYALTPEGRAVASQHAVALANFLECPTPLAAPRPSWERLRRELRLGKIVVKRFRRPASNQELILSAFEEQQWPERIDDPLPRSLRVDPRHRLHETIKSLNHCLESPVLHFGGDGTGLGLRWILRIEGPPGDRGRPASRNSGPTKFP